MTADEFKRIGRAVFGTAWKKQMAKELGCHRNTVYKLAGLADRLPVWVANHVRLLADQHVASAVEIKGEE